ncbi:hypothetical protein RFI_11484 [Reticulomyxa filosa]|uniref:Uncharacterized protein n=1 Tax=Reticulomyxa filosa TaxID=46433 RepID=X6NH53_RETFI|nr:hypothetical protein RFI_11484 [Reticulomyxa filosa]|eukprot:ETO25650.1 hypothetical protein RFI_11484 [Reticulomyxa filosa]
MLKKKHCFSFVFKFLCVCAKDSKSYSNRFFFCCRLFGIDITKEQEWNDSSHSKTQEWQCWKLQKCTIDMYVDMDTRQLKWKEVKKDNKGKEHVLRDNSLFRKYKHLKFVPHIFFNRQDATIQIMDVPPQMYGKFWLKLQKAFD